MNNSFATEGHEKVHGHNLTSTLQVNDAISLKNIAAYRDTFIFSSSQLDRLGGLTLPADFGGGPNVPFEVLSTESQATNRQVSDELQGNYSSRWLTLEDFPGFGVLTYSPESWIVNTRVALADIDIGGHTGEIAAWARNLTNNKLPTFPLSFGFATATRFQPARTYGLDLSFQF